VLVVENLPALAASPLRGQVRTVSSSPTVLETVLRSLGLPGSVHCVVAAGEALSRDLADRLFAARPGLRLVNAYGPTEATVYASFAEIRPHDRQPPPIGRAIANMELHVLDREARLLSAGAVGELCLGGAGVAAGYLNRPELTAERFIANPFGPGRLYRSGDRAKRLPDGQVVFLGRIDGQLKLHAMRIEAGEVEAALRAQSGVAAAAVGLHRTGAEMRLVAWVVPETPASTAAALRRGLAGRLPRSMVPASFVFLPALPLTPGGKLDRAALPEPSAADRGPAPQRAPATRAQQVIFDLWRKVLEIPAVRAGAFGIDDELVDLGGDSLTAVVICAEIEAACGKPVPGEVLADGITVARLAAWLEAPDQATGLHLLVDGRRIAPEILGEREFVFHLSLPAEEVRLVSHAAVPRRLGTAEDDRLLGVWLEEIVWEQGEKRQFLPLAVPFLGEGFHPTEVGGQRWTNGDAWLAGDLIPQWQGAVVLRLRAWVWQPNLPATPPSRRDTGLAEFESLGDNCEFGFVQQYFDIRLPPGLLRWAATDHRRLLSGLTNSFAALTLPNLIRVLPGDPDYRLATPYFNLHSFQPTDAGAVMQHDAMHRRGVAVLGFLRRKLLRDIAEARKIFVFKTDAADFDEPAMRGLHAALRRHGSAALLCVTPAAAGAPAGEVTRLDEGLYAAQVTRFVLAEGPYDEWLAICERTLHLHRRDR
jgi:hypothetical protein